MKKYAFGLLVAVVAAISACGGADGEEGSSCADIFGCVAECSSQDCFDQCREDGSDDATAQFDAVLACMNEHSCEDDACMQEFCSSQVNACQGSGGGHAGNGGGNAGNGGGQAGNGGGNGGTGGTGGTGGNGGSTDLMGCADLMDCALACEDNACLEACYANTDEEGMQLFEAIFTCADLNGCEDSSCVAENCGDQLAACTADTEGSTGTGGTGGNTGEGDTCYQIFECAMSCNDDACVQDCYGAGSATGQEEFDALVSCIIEYQCQDTACLEENCSAEWGACD